MKFKKFVKSLASSGIIYKRGFDRMLASPSAFMLIPCTVQSVTAAAIQDMPEPIDRMISQGRLHRVCQADPSNHAVP